MYVPIIALGCHVPDISSEDGLLDIIAVGNILELHKYMDRRYYAGTKKLQASDLEEMTVARWCYRRFQKWFSATYSTMVGDEVVSPMNIFQCTLVEFAAAVVNYKSKYAGQVPLVTGCGTGKVLRNAFIEYFTSEYPELLDRFKTLADKQETILWSRDRITIRPRVAGASEPACTNFAAEMLYPGACNSSNESEATNDAHPTIVTSSRKRRAGMVFSGSLCNVTYSICS